MNVVKFQL